MAWSSSCSRTAHTRKVLGRRAQSRIDQATLRREERASSEGPFIFDARRERQLGYPQLKRNQQARKEHLYKAHGMRILRALVFGARDWLRRASPMVVLRRFTELTQEAASRSLSEIFMAASKC